MNLKVNHTCADIVSLIWMHLEIQHVQATTLGFNRGEKETF